MHILQVYIIYTIGTGTKYDCLSAGKVTLQNIDKRDTSIHRELKI